MKKIFSMLAVATMAWGFTACETNNTEGLTRITYYPVFDILGENPKVVNIGEPYEDAGCAAKMAGEDVSADIKVKNNVDTDEMGIYKVTYSLVNADGFPASASRTVYVTNGDNFANLYFAETWYGSRHYTGLPVQITDNGDGTFLIDDLLGGFYWGGRYPGYEPNYDFHAESIITLNPDNTIGLVEVGDWYFGGEPITIDASFYDSTSGQIDLYLGSSFDGFHVQLTRIK